MTKVTGNSISIEHVRTIARHKFRNVKNKTYIRTEDFKAEKRIMICRKNYKVINYEYQVIEYQNSKKYKLNIY